jgi:hypothetical protein
MMPKISSNAATPIIVDVTLPFARYSCSTAKVAEGSVGDASDANNKESGIKKDTKVIPGNETTTGPNRRKNIATNRKANSASKTVIRIIDFPNERILENNNVPPTEKVINDNAIFVTRVVCPMNDSGMKWVKLGLRIRPARIYPVTLGRPRRVQSSPTTKPERIMIPIIRMGCIPFHL